MQSENNRQVCRRTPLTPILERLGVAGGLPQVPGQPELLCETFSNPKETKLLNRI